MVVLTRIIEELAALLTDIGIPPGQASLFALIFLYLLTTTLLAGLVVLIVVRRKRQRLAPPPDLES